jgi:hypothetical protein
VLLVPIILAGAAFLFYRMGYNAGYRKALEKAIDQRVVK